MQINTSIKRKDSRIIRPRPSELLTSTEHLGCPFCAGAKVRMDGRKCEAYGKGGMMTAAQDGQMIAITVDDLRSLARSMVW